MIIDHVETGSSLLQLSLYWSDLHASCFLFVGLCQFITDVWPPDLRLSLCVWSGWRTVTVIDSLSFIICSQTSSIVDVLNI